MKKLFYSLILFCSISTWATTITVNSASDIANATPSPGDTLLMSSSANWADQDITVDFEGTEANPITLLAEGNGQVILSGGATLQIAGSYVIVNGLTFKQCASTEGGDLVKFRTSSSNVAQNCRLTNTKFTDNNPSDLNIGYKWVSLYGKENRVDHCWFELKKHRGTTLVVWLTGTDDPNFHRIDHNYFTRPLLSTGNNEAETIRIGDSQRSLVNSNTIVEHNYFEECDGEIESISNKSCYNVYRYNTFFNNASILTLRHGHYCTVEGNYFFGNNVSGGGGVRIIGIGHKVINNYMQDLAGSGNLRAPIVIMGGLEGLGVNDATNRYVAAEDNIVAFNTIVNCKQSIYIGSDKASSSETYKAPLNNTIDNNIIYGGDDNALKFEYGEIASFNYSGNIFSNMSLGTSGTGFTETDPKFTFGSSLVPARINSNSPAIDASTGSYTLTEDFDGDARTGSYDVGCDEYSADVPVREPIEKLEVGPCWMNSGACSNIVVTPNIDCNGDENGTATFDNCGVCSGGETTITPNSTCEKDCNGDWDGTAKEDNCNVCSGGNTGIEVDACLECNDVAATSDDGNVAANVLDKDPVSRWSAQGEGEYLEFCFGTPITLTNVALSFYKGDERTTSFSIETSTDGVTWTSLLENQTSSGSSLELETFTVSPTNALRMRVIGLGNSSNDWNSITEVEWNQLITGINNVSFDGLKLYPNPTSGKVSFNYDLGNQVIEITNIVGETIQTGTSQELDLSPFPSGVYFAKVNNTSIKIIKQ